jgi:hypothetical protein
MKKEVDWEAQPAIFNLLPCNVNGQVFKCSKGREAVDRLYVQCVLRMVAARF